jgi:hypothetical protein
MFLRNYDNLIVAAQLFRNVESYTGTYLDGGLSTKGTSGGAQTIYLGSDTYYSPYSFFWCEGEPWAYGSTLSSGVHLVLGLDNTKETYEDYKMQNLITSNLVSYSRNSKAYSLDYIPEENCFFNKFSMIYTAKENFELGEIGIVSRIRVGSNSGAHCLIYRKALVDKIPIEKDQSFKITVSQKIAANPNDPSKRNLNISVN